jgi:hypothetical protein
MNGVSVPASRVLRWFGMTGACLLPIVAGCTQVLGIDGRYMLHAGSSGSSPSGTGGSAGHDAGAPQGGADASPPAEPHTDAGARVDAASAGGSGPADAAPPPPSHCAPGSYSGTFTGTYQPAVTFVGVPLNLDGTYTFDLSGQGETMTVDNGTFTATSNLVGVTGTLSGTLSGSYDCATDTLDATMSGKIVVSGTVGAGLFSGPFGGPLLNGDINRDKWSEQEQVGVDPASGRGTGSGTWVLKQRP